MSDPTFADVDAGVRNAIAAYAQALDDGRTDDVVALFCSDGGCDIDGLGAHEGHDALRAAFAAVEPKAPQRHLAFNTHITAWSAEEATAATDVAFLVKGDAGWSLLLVGRYEDVLHREGTTWRFHRSGRVGKRVPRGTITVCCASPLSGWWVTKA